LKLEINNGDEFEATKSFKHQGLWENTFPRINEKSLRKFDGFLKQFKGVGGQLGLENGIEFFK
jgi:hypothetical protein